jgi:hypothetical protein
MKTTLAIALLGVALDACGVSDRSRNLDPAADNSKVLCRPTGRAYVDTGVYIGKGACESITLYRVGSNNAWSLEVGYPTYQDQGSLTFVNRTTGDSENEALYTGDPEFTVYAGDYPLGGLEMVAGENKIAVYDYPCPAFDCSSATPKSEFTVRVQTSDAQAR